MITLLRADATGQRCPRYCSGNVRATGDRAGKAPAGRGGRTMAPVQVGVVKEVAPGERRVAITPDSVRRLLDAGVEVLVESGAGDSAWFPDDEYAKAGATALDTAQ